MGHTFVQSINGRNTTINLKNTIVSIQIIIPVIKFYATAKKTQTAKIHTFPKYLIQNYEIIELANFAIISFHPIILLPAKPQKQVHNDVKDLRGILTNKLKDNCKFNTKIIYYY